MHLIKDFKTRKAHLVAVPLNRIGSTIATRYIFLYNILCCLTASKVWSKIRWKSKGSPCLFLLVFGTLEAWKRRRRKFRVIPAIIYRKLNQVEWTRRESGVKEIGTSVGICVSISEKRAEYNSPKASKGWERVGGDKNGNYDIKASRRG